MVVERWFLQVSFVQVDCDNAWYQDQLRSFYAMSTV